MNVILATHDSVMGRFVAASLDAAVGLDRVLVEVGGPDWALRRRQLRRVGPVDALFQWWLGREMARAAARHLPALPFPSHERIRSVNKCTFGADDLVLAFGTSIVRAGTLARAPNGILNLHTGYLPAYRGVKAEFWALASGDRDRLGWTLHYMTTRLDAGDIVLRGRVPFRGDSPGALRAALLCDAVPAIAALIQEARASALPALPRSPQGEGRYFSAPRLQDWRAYRRRSRA